jgi:hypothetical protein
MPNPSTFHSLLGAIERYFDLMFDSDVSRFDQVFAPSAQLHGLRDGNLRLLPAQDYKNALASGPSPKSKNAPAPAGGFVHRPCFNYSSGG